MSGTRAGALKTKKKNLELNPNFYADIGRIGGKKGVTGGFASNKVGKDGLTGHERAMKVGKIGGMKSRRRKETTSA